MLGGFFSDAWTVVQTAWATAIEFFTNIWNAIQNVFSMVAEVLGGFFSAAWNAIQSVWGAAADFFQSIWNAIVSIFSGVAEWFGGVFTDAWNAVKSAFTNVGEFFLGIWDAITGAFSNVWDTFSGIGENIVKGLWNGISSFAGWLWDKISGWASDILDGVINIFDIHSPSKEFELIGKMIDEITITSLTGRGSITMRTQDYRGYWLGRVDWGQVESVHQTYSTYNQIGEVITSTSLGSRSLSIPGWVIEDADRSMLRRCEFLNSFISPVEDYILEYHGRQIQFRPDSSVVYSRELTFDNRLLRKFLIQATCAFPLFSNTIDTVAMFDFSTKQFRFPTDFGQSTPIIFATTEKLYNTRITNPGGFSTGVTIQINFVGNVTNPKIRDLQTNNAIGVDKSFVTGDRLTIVTTAGRKSITLRHMDETTENYIKYRSVDTMWLQLAPGTNIWALECSDLDQRANMNVQIMFTPLYLEVE